MKFTVLLLRPDHVSDQYGEDSVHLHVEANDVANAILNARLEALHMDNLPNTQADEIVGAPEDYFVLAAYVGHLENINPGE